MSFGIKLLCFWVLVGGVVLYLWMRPRSSVAKAALSWFGPSPIAGESWARFQLRWAIYSLGWLVQVLAAMTVVYFLYTWHAVSHERHMWLQVASFVLVIGAGMALFAALGFAVKASIAKLFGPNPTFSPGAQQGAPADHPTATQSGGG